MLHGERRREMSTLRDDLMREPEEFTFYDFRDCDACDDFGGMSHGHFCYLMKHKGIFIGFDDQYNWRVLISSDPKARWKRGCQDPRAYANPYPTSPDGAYFVGLEMLPEEAQKLELKWRNAAVEIARKRIQEV